MTESVLVTGGAGFLGSRIVRSYVESGIPVRAIGRRRPTSPSWRPATGVEFAEVDLCDAEREPRLFDGQDVVIHAAAVIAAGTPEERAVGHRVNVEATRAVIEACRRAGVRRFVHISTTAAISPPSERPLAADETCQCTPEPGDLSYAAGKRLAERLVLDAAGPDLDAVVVNPGVMFGRHLQRYCGGDVIERVLGRRVVICASGGLSMVHVDDVVDGVRAATNAGRRGERYILSGDNLGFRQIAEAVLRVSGRRTPVIAVPDLVSRVVSRSAVGDADRYAYRFYSSEKARSELGFRPRSFNRIVSDYLAHRGDLR